MSSYVQLPAPVPMTDQELAYMQEEPPSLFPQNQDSNYGYHRKVVSDRLNDVATQLELVYEERWPETGSQYLNYHEFQMGLPQNPPYTLTERRALVEIRYLRGPFTPLLRDTIIEFFIGLLLSPGTPATFGVLGIPILGGIPLYSGLGGVPSQYYDVVENVANFSYTVYINAGIGADIIGLTRELTRVTPAGITFVITARSIAGQITAIANVSGQVFVHREAFGGVITANASVSASFQLKGIHPSSVGATATVSGFLRALRKGISGFVTATATVSGSTKALRMIKAAQILATATTSGHVSIRRGILATQITATATVAGSILRRRITPSTQITAAATVTGAITKIGGKFISGSISAVATVTGLPSKNLVVSATATVSGSLTKARGRITPISNIGATGTVGGWTTTARETFTTPVGPVAGGQVIGAGIPILSGIILNS